MDAIVAGRRTDGAILVVYGGVTPKAAVRQFADLMRDAGVKVLGVVLNNLEEERALYYGRYYHYGYYEGAAPGAGNERSGSDVIGRLTSFVNRKLTGRKA